MYQLMIHYYTAVEMVLLVSLGWVLPFPFCFYAKGENYETSNNNKDKECIRGNDKE